MKYVSLFLQARPQVQWKYIGARQVKPGLLRTVKAWNQHNTRKKAPLTGRRARPSRQPRPLHHLQSKNRAGKKPVKCAGFFARFFSLRWLVVAAAVPARASQPLSWARCSSTSGKHCRELKHCPSAANYGATIIMRGFFSLLGCPWPRAAAAARPASGAARSGAPRN